MIESFPGVVLSGGEDTELVLESCISVWKVSVIGVGPRSQMRTNMDEVVGENPESHPPPDASRSFIERLLQSMPRFRTLMRPS